MPLTQEQMEAAEGARRLLADPAFQKTLDRMTASAAEIAVFGERTDDREASRQTVLAVARIRDLLRADVDAVELAKSETKNAKAFE